MTEPDVSDIAGLRLLEAVARLGSLSTAATELGLTQQAASLRMRALERQVGIGLLVRSRRGSTLTPAGALLNEWAAAVLDDVRRLSAAVATLRTDRSAHLRIAASLTVAEHLLPGWLVRLRDQQAGTGEPATDVELSAVNSDSVVAAVREGRADVGFIESPYPPGGLHTRTIGRDELLVVVRPDHPWARRRTPLTADVLARTAMVGREPGSGSRQWFDEALQAALADAVPRAAPALEVSSATAVRAAVSAGLGPAAISSLAVADDLATGRFRSVPVAGVDLARTLRAVWRGDSRPPAGPVRTLLDLARQSQVRRRDATP